MSTPHYQLAAGLAVTSSSVGVAWISTLDTVLRLGASFAGLVAACLTAAVAIRSLRNKK